MHIFFILTSLCLKSTIQNVVLVEMAKSNVLAQLRQVENLQRDGTDYQYINSDEIAKVRCKSVRDNLRNKHFLLVVPKL